jgi:integrase
MFVDFLSRYRAKTTRGMYVSAWVKFLSLAYNARLKGASPDLLDPWVAKYVNDLRNGRRDLASDLRAMEGTLRSPKTFLGYRSAIRTLLAEAGIALPPVGERQVRLVRRQPRPVTARDPLTPATILKLMEHLDTRGRAILYVLVSSGARLGEALSVRLDDLDLDSRPARFRIRDPGTGVSRVAFISREAVGAIRVYLIVRDRFVASARARGGTAPPDLLFPVGKRAFEQVFSLALSKARLSRSDRHTGRRTLTTRATRRFFAERMGTVLPAPVVRELMGGAGHLPEVFRGYTEEELEKAYLEGERAVTLHRSHRQESLARKIADLEKIVGILREQVGEMRGEPAAFGGDPGRGRR